jgi:hypothetical protein
VKQYAGYFSGARIFPKYIVRCVVWLISFDQIHCRYWFTAVNWVALQVACSSRKLFFMYLKTKVAWDVAPCILMDVYRRIWQRCLLPPSSGRCHPRWDSKTLSTSETSVNFCQTTRRNIPEDSYLHIRPRENLKSSLYFVKYSVYPQMFQIELVHLN